MAHICPSFDHLRKRGLSAPARHHLRKIVVARPVSPVPVLFYVDYPSHIVIYISPSCLLFMMLGIMAFMT